MKDGKDKIYDASIATKQNLYAYMSSENSKFLEFKDLNIYKER